MRRVWKEDMDVKGPAEGFLPIAKVLKERAVLRVQAIDAFCMRQMCKTFFFQALLQSR